MHAGPVTKRGVVSLGGAAAVGPELVEWLARASEGAIRVAGPERSETVYVLPVDARALAWR